MYNLARSCQKLQENAQFFRRKKAQKGFLLQKTSREKPRMLSKNPGKSQKKSLTLFYK